MSTDRPFCPRREVGIGRILVPLEVENPFEPSRRIECVGMVDTGAYGLVLPSAWKSAIGPLPKLADVDVEMADRRVVAAEVLGPVRVRIDGFRRVGGEVLFVDMDPNPDGGYEPLIGYTVLESCNLVVDMVRHTLIARKYYDLKRLRAA